MRLAILDLSTPTPTFADTATAAALTESWLAPHLPEAEFVGIDVSGGAPPPAAAAYDGYLLTGSEKGVYDDAPWIAPLKAFLRELRDANRPVFGICFGHQIMAEAYGGRAAKADKGFVIGVRGYETPDGAPIDAHAMHQDQVISVPPGARVTAASAYCPVAALDYDFPARSVQFHPEFSTALVNDAIEVFEGDVITPDEAAEGRASMTKGEAPPDLYGAEVAAFFRSAIGARAEAG
ncbi:MAG: type 1 glutamine amidotransferase [Pseudomonadota bacterium]